MPHPDRSLTGKEGLIKPSRKLRGIRGPDLLPGDVLVRAHTCVTHSRTSSPHFMVCGVRMDGCAATRTPGGGERRAPVRAHNNRMEKEQNGSRGGMLRCASREDRRHRRILTF